MKCVQEAAAAYIGIAIKQRKDPITFDQFQLHRLGKYRFVCLWQVWNCTQSQVGTLYYMWPKNLPLFFEKLSVYYVILNVDHIFLEFGTYLAIYILVQSLLAKKKILSIQLNPSQDHVT